MKIGLALGGGGALGAYHLGVLKAIEEKKIKIGMVSGTSIGALVGSVYSFKQNYQDIKDLLIDFSWRDISSFSFSKLGLLSNSKVNKFLDEKLGNASFDDAKIKLSIMATNITNGEKVILEEGDVGTAVMASMSIPGLFEPVKIEDKLLIDGGVIENVPITPLLGKVDHIIAVDIASNLFRSEPRNFIDVIMNSFQIRLVNMKRSHLKKADILIRPDLSKFDLFDTRNTLELIEMGYKDGKYLIKDIK